MVWWERNGVEYVFRLAMNESLAAKIARAVSSFGCDVPQRGLLMSTLGARYTAAPSGSKLQLSAGGPTTGGSYGHIRSACIV